MTRGETWGGKSSRHTIQKMQDTGETRPQEWRTRHLTRHTCIGDLLEADAHPAKGKKDNKTQGNKTLEKADTPSNKGKQEAYNGRQAETRCLGRRTHHPTKEHKKGYNGRQTEARPLGMRTHHPAKGNKKRYNGRQDYFYRKTKV